jgi:hypothetical protein
MQNGACGGLCRRHDLLERLTIAFARPPPVLSVQVRSKELKERETVQTGFRIEAGEAAPREFGRGGRGARGGGRGGDRGDRGGRGNGGRGPPREGGRGRGPPRDAAPASAPAGGRGGGRGPAANINVADDSAFPALA